MWGRRSIRFDLARLVHAEARRARRFGGLGPRVLRATACNPSFVSRDRHSLASQLREGGRDDSIASGSVCSVGHRIEPDFITRGFRVFGVFRGFTGLDFPGWLAAWSSELKERRPPVPVGSTEYPVRRGQTGSRGGAESAAVWRAWSPRPPRLRVKPLVRFTGPPLAGLAGRGGEGIGGPIPSGSVTSVCVPWATGFGRDRPTRRVIPDGAHSRLRHGGAVPGVIPAPSGRRGSRRWR